MAISGREFARRDGCSETLVRRAGKAGKLRVDADGKYDEMQVGSDWRPRDRELRTGGANKPANTETCSHPPKKRGEQVERLEPQGHGGALKRTSAVEFDEDGEEAGGTPLQRAILAKEQATAKLKDLEFRVKSGVLIPAETASNVLFEESRANRNAWLNWPTSVAPHMAAELGIDPDKLVEVMTRYVHEHLTELGEPAAPSFGQGDGSATEDLAPRTDAAGTD